MTNEEEAAFLHRVLQGSVSAQQFLADVLTVLSLWDEMTSGKIALDRVHNGFWTMLFSLPRNEFYRVNFERLEPLVKSAVFNWQASLKAESADEKAIARVLASSWAEIVIACCEIQNGPAMAITMAPDIWRFALARRPV